MNYLTTVKNVFKNKDRKTENLILLLVLLIILLISINYIFNSEDKSSNSTSNDDNININKSIENAENNTEITIENKLEDILSKINGIEDVSVMLTYSAGSTQNIVYNTTEEVNGTGSKKEKTVAYNEESGKKTAIVESLQTPKVEGVIIVARGANSVEIKSKIATAVATLVNVPVYKVQVFEK